LSLIFFSNPTASDSKSLFLRSSPNISRCEFCAPPFSCSARAAVGNPPGNQPVLLAARGRRIVWTQIMVNTGNCDDCLPRSLMFSVLRRGVRRQLRHVQRSNREAKNGIYRFCCPGKHRTAERRQVI
jgi:hypothetical protein